MNETETVVRQQLVNDGYRIGELQSLRKPVVIFENATVLGFVFFYSDSSDLIANWRNDNVQVIRETQFSLRRAGHKAWNTYSVFLADIQMDPRGAFVLQAIEEDLAGTRKIARAGVKNGDELRLALLPLLAIQNAPRLEPIDMAEEIRLRTSELPGDLVDGFIANAPNSVMVQLLESGK